MKRGPKPGTARRFGDPLTRYVVDDNGCWIWQGAISSTGYGSVWVSERSKQDTTHRFFYERLVGPIPEGLTIDHLCRVRACVNPAHLEPVTNAENIRRGAALITHCKHGHEYTPENTDDYGNGRKCRACRLETSRRLREVAKAPMEAAA